MHPLEKYDMGELVQSISSLNKANTNHNAINNFFQFRRFVSLILFLTTPIVFKVTPRQFIIHFDTFGSTLKDQRSKTFLSFGILRCFASPFEASFLPLFNSRVSGKQSVLA
jgi:hypothetical protein